MLSNNLNKSLNNLKFDKLLNKATKRSAKFTTLCIILGIYSSVLFFCLCCLAAFFLKIHPAPQSTTPNSRGAFKQEKDSKNNPNFLEIPILNPCSECSQGSEFKDDSHSCCDAGLKDSL